MLYLMAGPKLAVLFMKAIDQESVEYKTLKKLKSIRGNVSLRSDFNNLGSYRQVSRVLRKLIATKKLVKIGTGIYAKARLSKYSDTPVVENGLDAALREALDRLGVEYEPGSAEREYNEGKTTQIPVRNIVRLKSRCRRRIGYRNNKLTFEKDINAK